MRPLITVSTLQIQLRSMCSLGLLLIVLLKLLRRDNSAPSSIVFFPGFEKNLTKETPYVLYASLLSIYVEQEKTFGSFAQM